MDREGGSAARAVERAEGVRWVDAAEELARHERLLRRAVPVVSVSIVQGTALSFGVGVPTDAPYLRRARAEGIPTAPRSTGGSGVLHLNGDLAWAVVLPRSDPRVGRDYVHAYERLGQGVVAGLESLGVRTGWVDAPALTEEYCPLSSRGKVLETGGRIVGGAAQHATSTSLLHHGFVSWRVDRALVDRLFGLPTGGPSRRLGTVADGGTVVGPEELAAAVGGALSAVQGP